MKNLLLAAFIVLIIWEPSAEAEPWQRPYLKNCEMISTPPDFVLPNKLKSELTERIKVITDPRRPVEGWTPPGATVDLLAEDGFKAQIILEKLVVARILKLKCKVAGNFVNVSAFELFVRPNDTVQYSELEADNRYQFSLMLRSPEDSDSQVPTTRGSSSACIIMNGKRRCLDDKK